MTITQNTLRPGLLVACSTSIKGNTKWNKNVLEYDHTDAEGKRVAKWETERVISDPVENERAQNVRSKCRSLISQVCASTAFGYLCPEDNADKLKKAILDGQALAAEFNATAKLTRVGFYVITGRIAPDDVEAVKAINSEVRALIDDMNVGLKNLDVKVVRDAAYKARNIGKMLSPDAAARIQIAIDTARNCATRIVKAGEQGAVEVDRMTIARLSEARTAFLDMSEAEPVKAPKAKARAVDLTPQGESVKVKAPSRKPAAARI